mmetsp:Transcript_37161/g.100421  ORF Transcript_37161/g.100421 Transcript_37161/m.100421 type:complete len:184 (+) Transcript_37161:1513-2064(+)
MKKYRKGHLRPTKGMDIVEYRGYELQVEGMSMSAMLLGFILAWFVMVPLMPDNVTTVYFFGNGCTNGPNGWYAGRPAKLVYLVVALIVDVVQDMFTQWYAAGKVLTTRYSRLFYGSFDKDHQWGTIILLVSFGGMLTSAMCTYSVFSGARGYYDPQELRVAYHETVLSCGGGGGGGGNHTGAI